MEGDICLMYSGLTCYFIAWQLAGAYVSRCYINGSVFALFLLVAGCLVLHYSTWFAFMSDM